MNRIATSARLAISLAILSLSAMLLAHLLGMFPNRRQFIVEKRIGLCESLALNCSILASKDDVGSLANNLKAVVRRNDDVYSAALRRHNGQLVSSIGPHAEHWQDSEDGRSTETSIRVPIMLASEPWGWVEVAFAPIDQAGFWGFYMDPFYSFLGFVGAMNGLVFIFYLRRALTHLDPSRVVPDRVRSALDTLAEGLIVLDTNGRIAMANRAFAQSIGEQPHRLQGRKASDLPWNTVDGDTNYPWTEVMNSNAAQTGVPLALQSDGDESRSLRVNAAPITDDKGRNRGALVSFDDVTALEKKKSELLKMLQALKLSREEIKEQNEQLKTLATQDPLTSCLNRRSFFELFENAWSQARTEDTLLCGIMVDVDHFKSVNDTYGHAVGDEVLRGVSSTLRSCARPGDIVARFGGEEFSVVLPNTDLNEAFEAAERIRLAIADLEFEQGLQVQASLGVSCISLGAADPQELLEQADKCLYVAKRNGRNQVVRWDEVPADIEVDETEISRTKPAANLTQESDEKQIPFHAVTALLSALSFRDSETAGHSTRVADLCVEMARDIMSVSETYVLEIAAMLHDIGKIGVPDAILLKPGKLTEQEWRIMRVHDRIGVEIVKAAFSSPALVEIISTHRAHYGGDPQSPQLPSGKDIPVAARILAICDAYDAMVSDRVFRKGLTREAALAELSRHAGKQFDPELVQQFIRMMLRNRPGQQQRRQQTSKESALSIGLQIEQLAHAIDEQDLDGLSALAERLELTAHKHGIEKIEQVANQLRELVAEEDDLQHLIMVTHDLLDLCRSTQRASIEREAAEYCESHV